MITTSDHSALVAKLGSRPASLSLTSDTRQRTAARLAFTLPPRGT
jgi:hypothetical protein